LAWISWGKLARLEDPRVEPCHLVVTLPYPGASPTDVETQVVKIVEDALFSLEGVEYVESTALPNAATFHLKLEDGTPMDLAVERARGKVQAVKKELPSGVKDPDVVRFSTSNAPQLVVVATGFRSDDVLAKTADELKIQLESVDGVSGIDLRGKRQRAVRIQVDPTRLAHNGVSLEELVSALQASNVRVPAGDLRMGSTLTTLRAEHQFDGVASIGDLPLRPSGQAGGAAYTLRLRDLATVTEEPRRDRQTFLYQGQPAVALEVRFRASQNAVAIAERLRKLIASAGAKGPAGVQVVIAHDQPAWIDKSLGTFVQSLGEGMLLIFAVMTIGLGWRAALTASVALPLSIGATLIGFHVLGFSLDQISLAGLTVALGLLVDDAIVVTESIQSLLDQGHSAGRAAVIGTARVFGANNATTAIACASFLPLFFMDGATGMFVLGLPTGVVLALLASLIVAQCVVPWIGALLLKGGHAKTGDSVHPPREDLAIEAPEMESQAPSQGSGSAYRGYARLMGWVVRRPATVVALAVLCLGGTFTLLPRIGFQFFPKAEKPALFVSADLPRGTPHDVALEKAAEIGRVLRAQPSVADTSTVVGGSYAPIFYARVSRNRRDLVDSLVRLRPGVSTEEAAREIRRALADIVGVSMSVEELYYGPPVTHPVIIRLFGENYQRLQAYADEVKAEVRKQPGAINVKDSQDEAVTLAKVEVDIERALRAGVSPVSVGMGLRWLYGEDKVTDFRVGEDLVEVLLDVPSAPSSASDQVGSIPIATVGEHSVPMREVATLRVGHEYAELMRRNKTRIVEVTADVATGTLPAAVISQVDAWLKAKAWEPGYGFRYAGVQEETEKSFQSLGLAAAGALVLILVLLVLVFDSLALALVVLAAIPFALIGALIGLAATGNAFGFMAFLGLIALIGVYVNHKIYYVDRLRHHLSHGEPLEVAILAAGRERMRPVVLTALTAILGLLPLTLSGPLWSAFGWVNIFGLVSSIPLSLVVLPAMIMLVQRPSRRWLSGPRRGARTPRTSEAIEAGA
jgi:multidrug efflux pump subunit AcrB